MITNFYRDTFTFSNSNKKVTKILITSKNLDILPQKGTVVTYQGQKFVVIEILLNLDSCAYDIKLQRQWKVKK